MGDVSDETLMAFADGELPPAQRVQIESALARDPGLRARLEIFESTGRRLSAAFSDRLSEPLPQKLVDTVMSHRATVAHDLQSLSPAGTFWGSMARRLSFEIPFWQSALASIAVLLAGVGAGYHMSREVSPGMPPIVEPLIALDDGHLVVAGRLAQVLEARPGHIVHDLEDAGRDRRATARIRLTFRSQHGYCRQFEITGRSGIRTAEVACRNQVGSWQVRANAIGAIAPAIEKGAKPAGEEEASIEAAVEQLKIGDALGADEEAAVISRRWQP